MKKRTSVFVVVFVLALFIFTTTVSAATCPINVSGKPCGYTVSNYYQGSSVMHRGSHKYGGFLGIGQKTCNFRYNYKIYARRCNKGHILGTIQIRYDFSHVC